MSDKHSTHSSYREKLVEHLFVGELLRLLWRKEIFSLGVLKPEVDNDGYDVVLAYGTVLRHVQLKCSLVSSKTDGQNVNAALASKSGGCVVWILVNDDLSFVSFRWFGNATEAKPPEITCFPRAKHAKGNATGFKSHRKSTHRIPKSAFVRVTDWEELLMKLFGAMSPSSDVETSFQMP